MNYIREAEKYLWHYRDLERSLSQICEEITRLKYVYCPDDYPKSTISDGMPDSPYPHEHDLMDVAFKLKIYLESKEKTEKEMKDIERILDEISQEPGCENFGRVLKMWYIDKLPKEEIAEILGYSSRQTIYNIKSAAIKKFAISLFGLDALKAV